MTHEIDYERLVKDAFTKFRYNQGTASCVAFKRGAEWLREQTLAEEKRRELRMTKMEEALAIALRFVENATRWDGKPDRHDTLEALRSLTVGRKKPRPDGPYRVPYACSNCGHKSVVTEVVAYGITYVGGSANWCEACEDGLPRPLDLDAAT